MSIAENLERVRGEMAAACAKAGRVPYLGPGKLLDVGEAFVDYNCHR